VVIFPALHGARLMLHDPDAARQLQLSSSGHILPTPLPSHVGSAAVRHLRFLWRPAVFGSISAGNQRVLCGPVLLFYALLAGALALLSQLGFDLVASQTGSISLGGNRRCCMGLLVPFLRRSILLKWTMLSCMQPPPSYYMRCMGYPSPPPIDFHFLAFLRGATRGHCASAFHNRTRAACFLSTVLHHSISQPVSPLPLMMTTGHERRRPLPQGLHAGDDRVHGREVLS
jgi:hypothetical protein